MELTHMTAAELSAALTAGQVSATEVTQAHLDRIAAVDERASWIVTTTTRSSASMETYARINHRHGPRMNLKPSHRLDSAGPMFGNCASDRDDRATLARVSAGRLCVRIRLSRSSTAAVASSTRATRYSSSSETVSPTSACRRPRSARSNARGMPSNSSATFRASGSASSSALDSSDRAIVPAWMCMRSASRVSFSACSSSRVILRRSTMYHCTRKGTGRVVSGKHRITIARQPRSTTSVAGCARCARTALRS